MGKRPNEPTSREKLKSFTDRIVRLEEEKKTISDDIKDIYGEAKNDGFDPKALKEIVKDVMRTPEQRAARLEVEAIVDLYRASLGMLDGTPMGDAARRRYEREMRDAGDAVRREDDRRDERAAHGSGAGEDAGAGDNAEPSAMPEEPAKPPEPTEDEARELGRSDHAAGKRIVDNPFPAGSRNRAAYDEGYCEADGSDGMEIPKAWRRGGDTKKEERPNP